MRLPALPTVGHGGLRRVLENTPLVALLLCALIAARADEPAAPDETLWDALRTVSTVKEAPPKPAEAAAKPAASAETARNPLRSVFGFLDGVQSSLQRIGKRTKSDLKINGQHNLRYHMEDVSGSRDSYENATYYGRRTMGGGYTDTDVTISGKLLGLVSFETRYTDNAYGNPYDNRIKLSYATKAFTVEAGDIQAGVSGNSLVDFSRSLRGFSLSAQVAPGVKLTSLLSEEKAQTRTIVINGANRSGPYYVYAGQVVDGSVRVRVNNRDMLLGQDFTLDPYTGELNFLNGLIVQELDSIAITFETYGYNQSPGLLTGWRADVTAIKPLRFGVMFLNQSSNKRAGALNTKTEQFYGYNNAASPYVLEMPVAVTIDRDSDGKVIGATPIYPMTVTIAGLPQVYGGDYVVDPLLPNRVYFRMPIPSTQIIRIVYTPASSTEDSGDRSVFGLDMTTSLGKLGSVTAEMASSRLSMSGEGVGAQAWQIRGDMKPMGDRLRLNWTLKNIGSAFTAISSPGFRRNERGVNVGADYQASSRLKLSATIERSRRPAYTYSTSSVGSSSGLATTAGLDNYGLTTFRAAYQIGQSGSLSLNHNAMSTTLGMGGRSTSASDTVAYQQSLGQLSLDASVGIQRADTRARQASTGTGTTDPQTISYGSNSLTTRVGAKWRLGERLSVEALGSNSSIKSLDGKNNTAQDITLNVRGTPLRGLTATVGYQLQTSGGYSMFSGYTDYGSGYTSALAAATRQVSYSGLAGGGLTGYYGGGVNSGLGTFGNYSGGFTGGGLGYGSAGFGGNSRGVNFMLSYQPAQTVTVDLSWSNSSSVGDYLFNSKRTSLSLTGSYLAGERMSLMGGAMSQAVSYIGSSGSTNTTTLFLSAQVRPIGKLTTSMNVNVMRSTNTGASSTTDGSTTTDPTTGYYGGSYGGYFGSGGTNLTSFGLRCEYPIWLGNNLFLQYEHADSSGYLASLQKTLYFGVAVDLGNNMQMQIGWRDQNYLTRGGAGTSDYSYRVRSLDADIGLRF